MKRIKAFIIGTRDGFEQGPELTMGMSYEDLRLQDFYDAGTHIGCALGIITLKGWAGGF